MSGASAYEAARPWSEMIIAGEGPSTIEIAVARLVADRGALRDAAGLLSPAERARADAFRFERHRTRFIIGRAGLRRLLARRLDCRPESVEIVYGAWGKPAIGRRPHDPDLRFNLSHCDDVAVYAFAEGREIGIDVEAVREMPDAQAIAERYFSRRENDAYRALPLADRPLGFFNCWTRKEAFIKALGEGLGYPLDAFDVSLAPHEPARILRVGTIPGHECGWSLMSFEPAAGYVAAVVVER